jgi:intracellular septation protein A
MGRSRPLALLLWLLDSFGSLVAFWVVLHQLGLLAAILAGIVVGLATVAYQITRDKKVSPFTAFIAVNVVVFGILDLKYQSGFFVKLEPALGNVATGLFFLGSILLGKPVLVELAERGAGRPLTRVHRYLWGWTVAWGLFFFARAAGHVWLAYNASLDQALYARALLGPLTFGAMFVIEMPVRFALYGKRAFQRHSAEPPKPDVATLPAGTSDTTSVAELRAPG